MLHIHALRSIYSCVAHQQMHTDPYVISVHLLVVLSYSESFQCHTLMEAAHYPETFLPIYETTW
jgi:hypothetical protein